MFPPIAQEMPIAPSLLTPLLTMGVGGVLAGIILSFYRQDHRENMQRYADLAKVSLDKYADLADNFRSIVQENTAAITANTEIVRTINGTFCKWKEGRP